MTDLLFIITSAIALCVLLLAFRSPGYAVALAWSSFSLEQVIQQNVRIFQSYPFLFNVTMAVILAGSLAYHTFVSGKTTGKLPDNPETRWLYLLFLTVLASLLWTPMPAFTVSMLAKQAPYFIVYAIIAPRLCNASGAITSASKGTLAIGAPLALYASLADFGYRGLEIQINGVETQGNPLALSGYASTVLICAAFQLLNTGSKKKTVFCLFAITVCIIVILKTRCRGQALASALCLLLWMPLLSSSLRTTSVIKAATLVLLIVGLGVYFTVADSTLLQRWGASHMSQASGSRIALMAPLWSQFKVSGLPCWLAGLGNSAAYAISGDYPHNVPFEILCEEGVLGMLFFLLFVGVALRGSLKVVLNERANRRLRVNVTTLASLFTYELLLSLKQGSFLGSTMMLCCGISLSACVSRYSLLASQASAEKTCHAVSRLRTQVSSVPVLGREAA